MRSHWKRYRVTRDRGDVVPPVPWYTRHTTDTYHETGSEQGTRIRTKHGDTRHETYPQRIHDTMEGDRGRDRCDRQNRTHEQRHPTQATDESPTAEMNPTAVSPCVVSRCRRALRVVAVVVMLAAVVTVFVRVDPAAAAITSVSEPDKDACTSTLTSGASWQNGTFIQDKWQCLPAWRWGWGYATPITTGADWGWWSGLSAIFTGIIYFILGLPFEFAKVIWVITLFIMKSALDPRLLFQIFSDLSTNIAGTWQQIYQFIGVPGAGGQSMLMGAVIVIAFFYSLWAAFRPRTGAMRYHEVNNWFTAGSQLMATFIPISLILMMSTGVITHSWLMEKTSIRLINEFAKPLISAGTAISGPGSAGPTADAPCGLYTAKLRSEFAYSYNAPAAGGNTLGDAVTGAGATQSTAQLEEVPKMISRLWESTFMYQVGSAQFGSTAVGARAECYVMEWNRRNTNAKWQAEVMHEAFGVSGTSISETQANEMLRPVPAEKEQIKEMRSFLILAAACGFGTTGSGSGKYRTSVDSTKFGPQTGAASVPPNHTGPTGGAVSSAAAEVWLHREWTGIQNHRGRGVNRGYKDSTLSSNVCTAWMFPDTTTWPPNINLRESVGVKSVWVQNHANIDSGDAGKWEKKMNGERVNGTTGVPTPDEISRAQRTVDSIQGGHMSVGVFVTAVLSVTAAMLYFKAFAGLSIGVVIAHMVLALIFFLLPLLLFVMALPIQAAADFRKRVIRLFFATSLSYGMFYLLLTLVVLITGFMRSWVDAYFNIITDNMILGLGGLVYAIMMSLIPWVALKIIEGGLQMFGMGSITSFRGAMQFASGVTAAGIKLPSAKEFASDQFGDLKKVTHTISAGVGKGARLVDDVKNEGAKEAFKSRTKDAYRKTFMSDKEQGKWDDHDAKKERRSHEAETEKAEKEHRRIQQDLERNADGQNRAAQDLRTGRITQAEYQTIIQNLTAQQANLSTQASTAQHSMSMAQQEIRAIQLEKVEAAASGGGGGGEKKVVVNNYYGGDGSGRPETLWDDVGE